MESYCNEDGHKMYLVKMDFVQFGSVYVPVYGENSKDAVKNAYDIMTSLKRNDATIESVSLSLDED